jgi:hypothetical protein
VDEFEGPGQRLDLANIAAFEFRVVKGIQIVKGPDGVPRAKQLLANVRSNKPCAAGYQEIHPRNLTKHSRACRGSRLERVARQLALGTSPPARHIHRHA